MNKRISKKSLHLNSIKIDVDLTHGFNPKVAEEAKKIVFQRLAYFQLIREIGHHNVRSRRTSTDNSLNKIVEWTNASQSRQVFTRVMGLIKMENTWKSVTEVASLCNITPKATRTMITECDELGFLERCPDTHRVRANDTSIEVWHSYVKSLYDEDEEFILTFFNVVYRYYEGKRITKLANNREVTSHLLR